MNKVNNTDTLLRSPYMYTGGGGRQKYREKGCGNGVLTLAIDNNTSPNSSQNDPNVFSVAKMSQLSFKFRRRLLYRPSLYV